MKLASIEIIKKLRDHPNADRLQICEVLGWQVVVQKGIHQEGNTVVFITIDTILPKATWSESFSDKQNDSDKQIRLKNIKLRGEYSSGVVLPISEFPEFKDDLIGHDVTMQLGVVKYVKELPANLSGETIGDFPTQYAPKTDEDNGLNDLELVKCVLEYPSITITQKIDGSSITLVVENGELTHVCSRNLSKKETDNSAFWKASRKLNIPVGWNGTIQGELAGNGIQRNQLKLDDIRIFVFQIYVNGVCMPYNVMKNFCENELKCDAVPMLFELKQESSYSMWKEPLKKLQELADNQVYSSGLAAEGIVVRPSDYPKSKHSRRPLGFKLINRNYKD
jgi:RNA ligase (TIGR02306 family)